MIILKKTIFTILALILCLSVLFTGCKKSDSTPGGVVDAGEGEVILTPDIDIQEGEATSEADLGLGVDVFLSNKYYLEGVVYSGSDGIPVKLATDGKNLQFTTDFAVEQSKIVFGLIVLDDLTYVTLPESKKYTKLSDDLLGMMDMEDIVSVSEFQSIQGENNEDGKVTQNKVTINGEAGLCTTYTFQDTTVKLYSIGDKLVQVENYDEKGVRTMIIEVSSISAQIPSNQLTLKGLEEVGATSFFSSLISAAAG